MYSFEGQFKSKRQSPYAMQPTSIVRKMQEERRQRAAANKLGRVATKIQAFVRGFLTRRALKKVLEEDFNRLVNEIDSLPRPITLDQSLIPNVRKCLQTFSMISRTYLPNHQFIKAANLLLIPSVKSLFQQWLSKEDESGAYTVGRVIVRLTCYLRRLNPNSPPESYSSVVEVIKQYFFDLKSHLQPSSPVSQRLNRIFLFLCKNDHYFSALAVFAAKQATLPDLSSNVEAFTRIPENTPLLQLLRLPFLMYPSSREASSEPQLAQDLLAAALKDLTELRLPVEGELDVPVSVRIQRYVFPVLLISASFDLVVDYLYECATGRGSFTVLPQNRLKPSLDLLMTLLYGPVPRFLRERQLGFGGPSSANASQLASQNIAVLAWLFGKLVATRCPADGSTILFSPPFNPPPLAISAPKPTALQQKEDPNSDEEGEASTFTGEGIALSSAIESSELYAEYRLFTDTWRGETTEAFDLLQKHLRTLVRDVLAEAFSGPAVDDPTTASMREELLQNVPVLYSMLALYRPLPLTDLMPLTVCVSHPPAFMMQLWERATSICVADSEQQTIFQTIASGKLAEVPSNMDLFSATLLTFLNGLYHRLIMLNDDEINRARLETHGFTSTSLLTIAQRLRDLMLGLIDLMFPAHPPPRAQPGGSYVPVTMADVIARVERQRMAGKTPGPSWGLSAEESTRLRWCLYHWRVLFLAVQRVVRQIHAWWRRQRGYQFATEPKSAEDWLTTNKEDLVIDERSIEWMVQMLADMASRGLDRVQLGYFSCLNTGRDDQYMTSLSYRDWRTMTTVVELPFIFKFWDRVKFFMSGIQSFRRRSQGRTSGPIFYHSAASSFRMRVHRDRVYEDAFVALNSMPVSVWHSRLIVEFVNAAGMVEMGVDGGGLSREMLLAVLKEGFDPARGLFRTNDEQALYPNPDMACLMGQPASADARDLAEHYAFLGAILAKAIFEGLVVPELLFAPFFLAKLVAGTSNNNVVDFNHLQSLDSQLYRQLCQLKNYEGDVRDLELDFTIVQSPYGKTEVVELKPNGSAIPVTNATRIEYINLVANFKLNEQIRQQSMAFFSGMTKVIDQRWFQLFDPEELQVVISGSDAEIDIDDWQMHTKLSGASGPETEKVVELFWQFVRSLTEEEKRKLMRFATASSRPPMFGFKFMDPPFSIQVIPTDSKRLPTSSTCANLLMIPPYQTVEEMKEKFLIAISSNAGFEFS